MQNATRVWVTAFFLCACGSSNGDGIDAGEQSVVDAGAGSVDAMPDADPGALQIMEPVVGSELTTSAAMRFQPPASTARVLVEESTSGSSCVATAPYFECLLDLAGANPGSLQLQASAQDDGGAELATATVSVALRALVQPCTGPAADLDACIVLRGIDGSSAGFDGVSYLNADNSHALVNTATMTGIDSQVLTEPLATPPDGVEFGVMNESTAWTLDGGRCSLIRCFPNSRRTRALTHYEAGVLFLFPEHRDVGIRDFFQWQAPFYLMSQGSSSSEKDEVGKALRALAILSPEARTTAKSAGIIGPLLSHLLTRSRVDSVTAYLQPQAHPSAFTNSPNAEEILKLAAAILPTEIPPVAKITIASEIFPEEWSMIPSLNSDYAYGFTPAVTPTALQTGNYAIEIDLSTSLDANDRDLLFFPLVLRGNPTIVRTGATSYRIEGDFPTDQQVQTGGNERTLSRDSVAFFPHNGIWLGTPAMISVGGRASEDAAPNANNLD